MRIVKALLVVIALAAVTATSPAVNAQKKFRSGTISLSTKSVGFILGIEWGSGTMTLRNGRSYRLRIRTLKAGMAGIESISAYGTVYNLRNARDIEGTFAAVGAGLTIGGGVGVATLKNAKGVIIEIKETQQGIAAKIAASGIDIELR